MKFLKVSSYYKDFLNDYYQKNQDVITQSYTNQHNHLMSQYFAWSDNYGRLLGEKGIETMEIVANANYLQAAWNKEYNNGDAGGSSEILIAQIKNFKPDVLYFQDSISYNGSFIKELKEKVPSIKFCIGNLCSPFSNNQLESFRYFDFFTVCSPLFKKQLAKYSMESYNIPHAFDHRILDSIKENNPFKASAFAFIGSIFADEGFHSLRKELLEELIQSDVDISFYGNLPDTNLISLLKRKSSYASANLLSKIGLRKLAEANPLIRKGLAHQSMPKSLKLSKKLIKIAQPPVFGLDMFRVLQKASIGFNIHIDCAGAFAANMRMFETTGVGTCLITDYKKNLGDFFVDGEEAVSYKSKEECIEKINWLIDNPLQCKKIAENGQKRTLKDHNFKNRIDLFYEILKSKM